MLAYLTPLQCIARIMNRPKIGVLWPQYVIGVTESWATPEILDSELHGHELFRRDRSAPNRVAEF